MVNCTVLNGNRLLCDGIIYEVAEETISYTDMHFWIYLGAYVGLILVAGLTSGLTMGLLSLDLTSLKVLKEGGKPKERRHAARIVPLVERHHLLLVTLVLANSAAVETMPLCLDRISDPITAILVSVTAVLIFGEILPQALCTRYGLAIGAFLSPLVYILMAITFIVSYPLSKLLDYLLGEDTGTFYRRAELKALVGIHGPQAITENSEHMYCNEDPLTAEEVRVIKGTLEMREKKVHHAMMPLEKVFMFSVDTKLNEDTIQEMVTAGHSRIPVYEGTTQNVVGILMVKKLLSVNAKKETKQLRSLMGTKCIRPVLKVAESDPLFDLLHKFKTGKSKMTQFDYADNANIFCVGAGHLSVVCASSEDVTDTTYEHPGEHITGIITLEDVIEELILDEILDETDVPDGLARWRNVLRKSTSKVEELRPYRSEGNCSVNSAYGSTLDSQLSLEGVQINERTNLLNSKHQNKSLP